jgi:hypothetical protein
MKDIFVGGEIYLLTRGGLVRVILFDGEVA